MMNPKTSLLTITFNCMVAGIIAGILFSIFLCALVLFIAGTGNTNLSEMQRNSNPVLTGQHTKGVSGLNSDRATTTSSNLL
jgi:hypothetical protein